MNEEQWSYLLHCILTKTNSLKEHSNWARSGTWSLRKHPHIPLIRRCNELFSGTLRSSSAVHRAIIATECITFPSRSTWCIRATFSILRFAFVFQESRSNTVQSGRQILFLLIIDDSLFRNITHTCTSVYTVKFYFHVIYVRLSIKNVLSPILQLNICYTNKILALKIGALKRYVSSYNCYNN